MTVKEVTQDRPSIFHGIRTYRCNVTIGDGGVLDYSPIALHVVYGLSSEKLHSVVIVVQGPSGLYHFPL